jgi:hypothetical protein
VSSLSTATRYQIQDRAVSYRPIPTIIYTARPHSVLLHLHGPVAVPHDPGERCVAGAGLVFVLADDEDGAGGVGAGHSIAFHSPHHQSPCTLGNSTKPKSVLNLGGYLRHSRFADEWLQLLQLQIECVI